MTQVILVRHGETEWNRVERFRGWADVPLNETGLAQAPATGRRVAAEWQPVAIYSSPLSRAVKTAEAIARHFNLPVQAHQGLIDIHHGQWQGLTPDEVRARCPELFEAWYAAPHTVRMPDGETLSEVRARGLAVVLVGHTDINRAILLAVLGLNNTRF